jgi:hypothetical protein
MNITVEFLGLPTLSAIIGKKVDIDVPGDTIVDLVNYLVQRFGSSVRQTILDSEGNLDPIIQVMLNDEGFISRETIDHIKIDKGDTVKFLLLAGGG